MAGRIKRDIEPSLVDFACQQSEVIAVTRARCIDTKRTHYWLLVGGRPNCDLIERVSRYSFGAMNGDCIPDIFPIQDPEISGEDSFLGKTIWQRKK